MSEKFNREQDLKQDREFNNDTTQFFVGTPSNEEVKNYFLRQKR